MLFVAFQNKPLTYNEMLNKAKSYTEKGQIAFAMEEYRRMLDLYPKSYDVHLGLAELYEKIDEIDRAKVQYIMAIRLGQKHRTEAYTKLARLYCKENKYNIAADILEEIKDTTLRDAVEKIGHVYFNWGEYLKPSDKLEAMRKYKEARKYYAKASKKDEKKVLKNIIQLYADISDELILSKQFEEAIEVLKLSLDYEKNAIAHYKLARIYEEKGKDDKALDEYSDAFKLDPNVAGTNSYVSLLIKKAQELKKQGDNVNSQHYYRKAKKLDSGVDVPLNPDKRLIFSLSTTRVNEDLENDLLVPGIAFRFINISPEKIEHLRAKVVFLKNNKPISTQIFTIADKENFLNEDSSSQEIEAYSTSPINHVFDEHDLRVQVYISQYNPDKWTLFRNIRIERERKPVTLVE